MPKKVTDDVREKVKELYPKLLSAEIAAKFGVSEAYVHKVAHLAGIKKEKGLKYPPRAWPADKEKVLREKFATTDNKVIAAELQTTVRAIRSRAQTLGLKKDNGWSNEDKAWLLANYSGTGVGKQELLNKFPNRTWWAIVNMYRELSGKRSKKNSN